MTRQAWRSLVTPWVVRHRRHSSWRLWGSHILLLYILHICSLSHCECNGMCNQLWSNHTYPINLLFFIIFHYSSLFSLFLSLSLFSFCCKRCYTFSCDTALMQQSVSSFISFNILLFVLFHSFGVLRPFGLWYWIWNAAHKILGGICNPAVFGWYLGHLESPITLGTCLVLMWIFHIFISLKSKL